MYKQTLHIYYYHWASPLKNMTWIHMETPCHFMSQIDGSLSSKLTPSSMAIPCNLYRFYLLPMMEHGMDFGQVQVMGFIWHLLRKWWDFHWIRSHFRPNCNQKDMRKSMSHFLQGWKYFKNTRKVWIKTFGFF